ncbi:MAG: preprotein translocase subunit SecA, partial [bacterium]
CHLAAYMKYLQGQKVHIVTVNDYLVRRDAEFAQPIFALLGATVGFIQAQQDPGGHEGIRKAAYGCDVTYGTNSEFGFDYLRDNMALRWEDKVQRGHHYVIVDEVDSILIDEARTPLIISGAVESEDKGYDRLTPLVRRLFSKQNLLVNQFVEDAEKLLEQGQESEAAVKLLQARRGAPKNKRLAKVERGEGVKRMVDAAERAFIRDKSFHTIDEELFFVIDEQTHSIGLTDQGRQLLAPDDPTAFVLPELSEELSRVDADEALTVKDKLAERDKVHQAYARRSDMLHSIHALLKAFSLFEKDVEYVVQDGKVMIVDEFTGRLMPGRRFSDGLHGALEAKESVAVQSETQTFATVTLQNYFRMYEKLAGMTGTAITSQGEFFSTYKLAVITIPTNEPVRRVDYPDVIYKTRKAKYNAVIDEIEHWHGRGRPILVGTTSVEASEVVSRLLRRRGINHQVLNARHHQQEAAIIAQAGQPGAVTIATNMAGRGTDIKLGAGVVKSEGCYLVSPAEGGCQYWEEQPGRCDDEVPCGLYIIGTERHEARRIDDQLRGRSGRQGDPGSSRFYLSLEDDLMRLFGSERVASIMDRFGAKEDEPIEHALVTRAIANAQKRVEVRNSEIRRHLLEYDDVMNRQREVVYTLRDAVLREQDARPVFEDIVGGLVDSLLTRAAGAGKSPEEWDWDGLAEEFRLVFLADPGVAVEERARLRPEDVFKRLTATASRRYDERLEELGSELLGQLCRHVLLRTIDAKWRDHLYALDGLREGIGLRAYGQKDPLVEYKQESFRLFEQMMTEFQRETVTLLFRAQVRTAEEPQRRRARALHAYKPSAQEQQDVGQGEVRPARREAAKVGRNDLCPCGSGKKYKKCCGRNG